MLGAGRREEGAVQIEAEVVDAGGMVGALQPDDGVGRSWALPGRSTEIGRQVRIRPGMPIKKMLPMAHDGSMQLKTYFVCHVFANT